MDPLKIVGANWVGERIEGEDGGIPEEWMEDVVAEENCKGEGIGCEEQELRWPMGEGDAE